MSNTIANAFVPNVGLTGIELSPGLETLGLPDHAELAPSEETLEGKLLGLLQAPHYEHRILQALRPQVENQLMFTPARFQSLAGETMLDLEKTARNLADEGPRQVLMDAAQILREDQELRNLLNTYRHALHKA